MVAAAASGVTDMDLPGDGRADVRAAEATSGQDRGARRCATAGWRGGGAGSAEAADGAAHPLEVDVTAGGEQGRRPGRTAHSAVGRLQAPHVSLPVH